MLGQSISLALLSVSGLVSGFPTEKRQELGVGGSTYLDPDEPSVGFESGDIIVDGATGPIEFPVDEAGGPFSDIPKRSVNIPAAGFAECSSIDLAGVEAALTPLLNAYASSPDTTTFVAMQPLHDILRGCGVNILAKRAALAVPTEATPFDIAPLEAIYSQLEAALGQPTSLTELITMDSILTTIQMNNGDISKRMTKRAAAAISCSDARINAWRLGLFTIAASYDSDIPITVWLIAENLVAMLNSCGVTMNMQDIFGLGTPITGGLEPDPTVPGGEMVPDNPSEGGAIVPEEPIEGGAIEPDIPSEGGALVPEVPEEGGALVPEIPIEGGSMDPDLTVPGGELAPDPIITVTLTPGSVETGTVTPEKAKREENRFSIWAGKTSGMVPDPVIPGGMMKPDPVVVGAPMIPDVPSTTPPHFEPPKDKKRWFGFGKPIVGELVPDVPYTTPPHFEPPKDKKRWFGFGKPVVGELVPDVPYTAPPHFEPPKKRTVGDAIFSLGKPIVGDMVPDKVYPSNPIVPKEKRQIFSLGTPIVGNMVPDVTIPTTITPRSLMCNMAVYEAMMIIESTYGRACDGQLPPSIMMAQQALVMLIFRECGSVWENWEIVELNGGFIEIGPVYSSGVVPSD